MVYHRFPSDKYLGYFRFVRCATINANSGLATFTTSITAVGLVENFDQVLSLFTEVVRTPKFPTEEVERYKSRTVSAQGLVRGQATFLAQERLNQAIYGTHPASLVLPPADGIRKLTPADLMRFHDENYVPNNAMLAIAGDVTLKEILPKLEAAFGDWKSGSAPKTVIPAAPAQSASKIYLINRPGSVQTVFQIGALGIERTDPDYAALAVMNRILGGGGSSRLFLNIREDKSYAYSVSSNFNSSKYRGTFVANAPVRTEATEGALREFMSEFNRIRDEKVSANELDNAKRSIVGAFALSLENPGGRLQTSSRRSSITCRPTTGTPANRSGRRCHQDEGSAGQVWHGGGIRRGREAGAYCVENAVNIGAVARP